MKISILRFSIIFIWEKKHFIFCTLFVGWVETSEPDITSFLGRLLNIKYCFSCPRLISLIPGSVLFIIVSIHVYTVHFKVLVMMTPFWVSALLTVVTEYARQDLVGSKRATSTNKQERYLLKKLNNGPKSYKLQTRI